MNFLLECVESLGLIVCIILAAPLSFFRRLDRVSEMLDHASYLMRHQLFASWLRSRLDYRMGHPHQAAVLLSPLVRYLEEKLSTEQTLSSRERRLLCALYEQNQELYLLSGQIEEAAQLVVRAHKNLGLDRLPSNPDFDLKTAHVVRAGLAASKLLEDGGLATLMVRPGQEPFVSGQGQKEIPKKKPVPLLSSVQSKNSKGATIIAFPKILLSEKD